MVSHLLLLYCVYVNNSLSSCMAAAIYQMRAATAFFRLLRVAGDESVSPQPRPDARHAGGRRANAFSRALTAPGADVALWLRSAAARQEAVLAAERSR